MIIFFQPFLRFLQKLACKTMESANMGVVFRFTTENVSCETNGFIVRATGANFQNLEICGC